MWCSTAPTLCRSKRSCSIISVPGSAVTERASGVSSGIFVHQDYRAVLLRNKLSTSDDHHQRMSVSVVTCPRFEVRQKKLMMSTDESSAETGLSQTPRSESWVRTGNGRTKRRQQACRVCIGPRNRIVAVAEAASKVEGNAGIWAKGEQVLGRPPGSETTSRAHRNHGNLRNPAMCSGSSPEGEPAERKAEAIP